MSLQFNPFATNPLVPSTFSYTFLTLSTANTELVWPSSFIDGAYYVAAYIEVVSNNATYNIKMPDARLASPGAGCIISNEGANDFNVVDNEGNVIVAGIEGTNSVLIYLTDASTQGGEWSTLIIGAKTAEANAAELAGQGLMVIGTELNVNFPITDLSVPTLPDAGDRAELINWTGGTDTLNLPTSFTNGYGVYIRNSSPSNGILTVQCPTRTIDGEANIVLTFNQSALFIFNGVNWFTVGLGRLIAGAGVALSPEGIKVVNGTAANPSYSFINSPNTGLSISGGYDLNVSIAGTNTMVISNTGINVKSGNIYWGDVNLLYFTGIYP